MNARLLAGFKKSFAVYRLTWGDLQATKPLMKNIEDGIDHTAEIIKRKQQWALKVFSQLNIQVKVIGRPNSSQASLFVGNHVSYLDIPLLMKSAPHVSFVAKKEVGAWPVFGAAARAVGTVFVERGNFRSRRQVRESISQALSQGLSIALFPSGTTTLRESTPWKKGAFEIAHKGNYWLQPFRISYTPSRVCAYIDDDFFLTHLIRVGSQEEIRAKIEFHAPIKIKEPIHDCRMIQSWTQNRREIY